MAWRRPGDKPLYEPMMVSLPTHICVTRPQWVKETAVEVRAWRSNSIQLSYVHVITYPYLKPDAGSSNLCSLQWRHDKHGGLMIVYSTVFSRCRSKKTSKLSVIGLCKGNSPVTDDFPAQRASNAENVSIWWRHSVVLSVWGYWKNPILRKRWRTTACCGKSKFVISSGWLTKGSVSHPDDIITLS